MTAAALRFHQVDVFTEQAGMGNPLGVVLGAQQWGVAQMQRFAAWTNLVETTFVLPPEDPRADYRLRIFTPSRELAFAGHPSIGSAHVVVLNGLHTPREGLLWQQCEAGVLPIRVAVQAQRPAMLSIAVPPAHIAQAEPADLHELMRIIAPLALGVLTAGLVVGGRRWWLAELAHEQELRAWKPDHQAIARLAARTGSLGLCVFARSTSPNYELAVRAFPAGAGIIEDPASGAANALIAAFVSTREPNGPLANGYRASQGREIGRDAHLHLRIEPDATIWVGGHSVTVISGELQWPSVCP